MALRGFLQGNGKIVLKHAQGHGAIWSALAFYVIDEVADAEYGIGDYLSCQFQMLVAKLADIGLHVIVGAKDFIDGGDDEKG